MEVVKRCPNFSKSEETLLLRLVDKYKNKIENKKTDGDTNYTKKITWERMEKEFNSAGVGPYRTTILLKRKYENMKKRAKSKYADEKIYIRGTGGEPAKPSQTTDIDEKIKEIIGAQMTGRDSFYDCDAELKTQNEKITLDTEVRKAVDLVVADNIDDMDNITELDELDKSTNTVEEIEHEAHQNDWSSYSPAKMRMPKSTPLVTKKVCEGVSLNNKLTNWAQNKVEMNNLKKDQLIEEQKLHLEFLRESYKLNLDEQKERLKQARERHELFVQESNLRMNIMTEEHQKKMEILTMKNNQS